MGNFALPAKYKKLIQKQFNLKYGHDNADWKVLSPEVVRSVGENALQCGPFVCYYAEGVLRNWKMTVIPSVVLFRKHILATLFGGCSLQKSSNGKCGVCNIKARSSIFQKCSFCERLVHKSCLEETTLRGYSYWVCKNITST